MGFEAGGGHAHELTLVEPRSVEERVCPAAYVDARVVSSFLAGLSTDRGAPGAFAGSAHR
jgi:hypothetical protein